MKPSLIAMTASVLVAVWLLPAAVSAATPPLSHVLVQVICDSRLGAGTVTDAADGYVVTAGHVVIDAPTGIQASACNVLYQPDGSGTAVTKFAADVVHAVYDDRRDLDFAVLQIGRRLSGPAAVFADELPVDEFTVVGQAVTVYGYPDGTALVSSAGHINGYRRGQGLTEAVIKEGYSGGPAVDDNGGLVGIANKVFFQIDQSTGQETPVDYEFGDALAMLNWLDGFGAGTYDHYLRHLEPARFQALPYLIRDEQPPCLELARTAVSPTVYCLMTGDRRLAFPDEATYRSWYRDWSKVLSATPDQLAGYRLAGDVTYQAGSLIKITTDPAVYLVVDGIGTLRRIPSEARAAALFGSGWSRLVKDVPEIFFADYTVHDPLP